MPSLIEAQYRHAEHYLELLRGVSGQYEQGGQQIQEALKEFDANRSQIEHGQTWAAAHSATNDEAASLCAAYPYVGGYCLDLRLTPSQWIAWVTGRAIC